jgi:hypothetical protein
MVVIDLFNTTSVNDGLECKRGSLEVAGDTEDLGTIDS